MPPVRVVDFCPPPILRASLPQSERTLSPLATHRPASRRFRVPERLAPSLWGAIACFAGCLLLMAAASCPRARADDRRPPDMPALLGQLDALEVRALALDRRIAFLQGARAMDRVARLHFAARGVRR